MEKKLYNVEELPKYEAYADRQWRPPASLTPAQRAKLAIPSARGIQSTIASKHGNDGTPTPIVESSRIIAVRNRQRRISSFATQRRADQLVVRELKDSMARNARNLPSHGDWQITSVLPPMDSRLHLAVLNWFPPRMELPVIVCDVFEESAVVHQVKLCDIEGTWKTKASGSIIRWIHIPLGHGIVHSSIEDMFCHDQPSGRPFHHAGNGRPFLELASIHFRSREELTHLREIYNLRHDSDLRAALKSRCFSGDRNQTLQDDVEWRLKHYGKPLDFFDLVADDLPCGLEEYIGFNGSRTLQCPEFETHFARDPLQFLSAGTQCDLFSDAPLVCAPFRSFHREDGVLLTMSAATGVDLLHQGFQLDLHEPPLDRLLNSECSVVGNQIQKLKEHGAADWYEHSVEWFLVRLISEIGTSPRSSDKYYAQNTLQDAMYSKVWQLKQKLFEPLDQKRATSLVKDYILQLDELRALETRFKDRISFFERLANDLKEHVSEQRDNLPKNGSFNRTERSAEELVELATVTNQVNRAGVDLLISELSRVFESFIRLRTLEQDMRAISSDISTKSITIFTAVTVVFLPLSFFCSYFAMNLDGIRNTSTTPMEFWQLGGTITVTIVVCAVIGGYFDKLTRLVKRSRYSTLSGNVEFKSQKVGRLPNDRVPREQGSKDPHLHRKVLDGRCEQIPTRLNTDLPMERIGLGDPFLNIRRTERRENALAGSRQIAGTFSRLRKGLMWLPMNILWMFGVEYAEPEVPSGYVRVRWKCRCGTNLYDDFAELSPGAALLLKAGLDQRSPQQASATGSSSRSSTELSDSQSTSSNLSSTSTAVPSPSENALTLLEPFWDNSRLESQNGCPRESEVFPHQAPRYLLTCIREGKNALKLSQLPLHTSHIRSDTDLIFTLRSLYAKVNRSWYRKLRLRGLVSIDFVKFDLHRDRLVDIRECPDVPPRYAAHDYEFERSDTLPPIGSNYLIHLFRNPHVCGDEVSVYQRVPKKLTRLESGPGWGIQLNEGFLPERLWAFIIAVLILFGSVFALVWTIKEHDMQAGFGVASFVTALVSTFFGLAQVCLG